MRKVRRDEIVDYVTYDEGREQIRAAALDEKKPRRIHVGDELTFLFETTGTIRYQVLEMMRAERIVKEADIQHELDTYNDLLGGPGELGCTLLIEIVDEAARADKLKRYLGLPEKLYAKLEDGSKAYAMFDAAQVGDERLSSVQYLKLDVGGRVPVALGCEHPELTVETELSGDQRAALAEDLKSDKS